MKDKSVVDMILNKINMFKSTGLKPELLLVSNDMFEKLNNNVQILNKNISKKSDYNKEEYWNINGDRVLVLKTSGKNVCEFYSKELQK